MPFLSKIRLNGTLYDLKVAGDAMVTGVKGDAESDYRVGDVNITPENVGTISTEDTQSLTDTQKSTARDNLGLGSAATRSVPASGNANATQVVLGSDTRLTGSYKTDDTESTTINDTDYVPMSETDGTKKKTLWSTIVAKVKDALGISSSGSTYLKKDGTWGTPANTTYSFATGDNNGQIKVTPSGGSAQNVSVKGLGSAAYTASTSYDKVNGWVTNEAALSSLSNGTYWTNPNAMVTEVSSLVTDYGFSEYGTIRISGKDSAYVIYEYVDVFGNYAVRNVQDSKWRIIYTNANRPEAVKDIGNGLNTTFAFSKVDIGYDDFTWLAAWNGYELRGTHKGIFPPKSHASTGTGYGAGNASNYGHVKLSDTYSSNVGGASSSIGASQSALYNVYSLLPRSRVYIDSIAGSYPHPSGFSYYKITGNVPKSGYYIAMFTIRCYGDGTYPEYLGIHNNYNNLSADAIAGTIILKQYGWQTVTVVLQLTAGNNADIVYIRNHTNSPNLNVRTSLHLLQPT